MTMSPTNDFFIYILECNDGSFYIGHTNDLQRRISAHHQGIASCYTFFRRPIKLVFYERCPDRLAAFGWERRIKGWSHQKKKALIEGNWNSLKHLSKKKFK